MGKPINRRPAPRKASYERIDQRFNSVQAQSLDRKKAAWAAFNKSIFGGETASKKGGRS